MIINDNHQLLRHRNFQNKFKHLFLCTFINKFLHVFQKRILCRLNTVKSKLNYVKQNDVSKLPIIVCNRKETELKRTLNSFSHISNYLIFIFMFQSTTDRLQEKEEIVFSSF